MQKKGLKIFKTLIFICGLIVLTLAYCFSPDKEEVAEWRNNYLWISII